MSRELIPILFVACSPALSRWTNETFVDAFEAEVALSHDRPGIISCPQIMALVPTATRALIVHPNPVAQVQGYHDLFEYLNIVLDEHLLRDLITAFFLESRVLRHHLSESIRLP